jgi:manganese/iron transport system ATP-binding protein/manganese/zinc/iron transport system ATP- binding protein
MTARDERADPVLEVSSLDAGYSSARSAIQGVDFAVHPGELVAVLGPNGGGKTTLFRALLGELVILSGSVRHAGALAYVPQTERARLDYPVSALDVALMGTFGTVPWHRRLGATERRAARTALDRVDLGDHGGTPFGELSGGQRQRVLIARALAQAAPIMLLDEPLSGVDRPSTERILAVLEELRAEGRAVLIATHDIGQAREFDRVLCLNRDQIAFGPPAALDRETLERTYGSELVMLDGERAIVVDHHSH